MGCKGLAKPARRAFFGAIDTSPSVFQKLGQIKYQWPWVGFMLTMVIR
jgi:hypothetical protein